MGGEGLENGRPLVRCTHSKNLLRGMGAVLERSESSVAADEKSRLLSEDQEGWNKASTATVGVGVSATRAEAMYALSSETSSIDRFVSHSWSASRWLKWLALSDGLYRGFAMRAAVCVWAALSVVALSGRAAKNGAAPVAGYGPSAALFIGVPLATLFWAWTHGPSRLGCERVFLDRLCIHQTDAALKRRGIESLGEAIARSDILTVVFSSDYLQRLWCVYELASFVATRRSDGTDDEPESSSLSPRDTKKNPVRVRGRVEILPLWVPPLLMCLVISTTLQALALTVLQESPWFAPLLSAYDPAFGDAVCWVSTNLLPAVVVCWVLRTKAEHLAAALADLARFKLDACSVTVESDRAVVYAGIANAFGSVANFETYVRRDLRRDLARRTVGIRYSWLVLGFLPYLFFSSVDAASISPSDLAAQGYPDEARVYVLCATLYFYPLATFCVFPLSLFLLVRFQQHTLSPSRRLPARCLLLLVDLLVYSILDFIVCDLLYASTLLFFSADHVAFPTTSGRRRRLLAPSGVLHFPLFLNLNTSSFFSSVIALLCPSTTTR